MQNTEILTCAECDKLMEDGPVSTRHETDEEPEYNFCSDACRSEWGVERAVEKLKDDYSEEIDIQNGI